MNSQLCVRCGEFVTTTKGTYRQVTGWEEVGKTGHILDSVTTGQVMHRACMVRAKHHPGQKEMFG
jgi:hypothetical protein